jgi:hypothetical protein
MRKILRSNVLLFYPSARAAFTVFAKLREAEEG